MADEATSQASEETQQASVEETTADSQSENKTDGSTQTSTEQQGQDQQDGKADKASDQTASTGDKSKSENQDSKQDSKPQSRRSAAYRLQQILPEYTRLKAEDEKRKGKQSSDQDEGEEEPRTDESPSRTAVEELVRNEVEKRLNPVVTASSKAADDAEINDLFSGDKANERTKYESKIRDMWKLPQYKDVAAADLYKILSHGTVEERINQAKVEAVEEYKKAQKEAKDSSASGSNNISNRTGKSGKSVADMTPEELEEHNQRVIAGQAT